jgi:hypothetical protein
MLLILLYGARVSAKVGFFARYSFLTKSVQIRGNELAKEKRDVSVHKRSNQYQLIVLLSEDI